MEVRLALDYLDIAYRAGATIDLSSRIPVLTKITENLTTETVSTRELLEVQLRLENLIALNALHLGQHLQSGQAHLKMAAILDQQLLTYQPEDPTRIERLHVKTGMLMNAIAAFHGGNRMDLAQHAAALTEDATNQLIAVDPGNQNWIALLLQVRLLRIQYLPPTDAAKIASETLSKIRDIRWDSPQNAEKARQIQVQLSRLQPEDL